MPPTSSPAGDAFDARELTSEDCWAVLRDARVGRLAMCAGGRPSIFPINFVVDGHSIVFRTSQGTKLSAARNAEVAFEVDEYDAAAGDAISVIVDGRAQEITEPDDWEHAQSLPLFPWHVAPKGHFVRIVPTAVSGRRFRAAYVGPS